MGERRRIRDLSLGVKLAALLAVASILPLVAAAYVDIRDAREERLRSASELLEARGDQLVHELDTFHRSYLRSAAKISRLPIVSTYAARLTSGDDHHADFATLRDTLDVQSEADPMVWGVAIVDREGRPRISTVSIPPDADLSRLDHIGRGLAGEAVVSDVYMARSGAGETASVAYVSPVRVSGGEVAALVVVWVDAAALWKLADASNEQAGRGSFAVLFDHDGVRVAHTSNADIVFRPGGHIPPDRMEELVAEGRFGSRTREILADVREFPEPFAIARSDQVDSRPFRSLSQSNHEWHYGVARRFQTVPWTVFYFLPLATLDGELAAITQKKVAFAAVIMLSAIVMGVLLASPTVRRVRSIAGATAALAGGDLSLRLRDERKDEVGQLARDFDAMAAELEKARDRLEDRVRERTVELERTTASLAAEVQERRRAEEAARESERSLATTLDSIGDAVIATDVDGRVTRLNPVAEELTGWSGADAAGRPLAEVFRIVSEETRETVESPCERVLREGIVVGLANHTLLIARDGSERPIADSGAPIRDAEGRVHGVVLVFRDQTVERRLEDMRIRSLKLEAENLRVEEASRLKSEFLANMSHELRTPLNAIIGFAELLHDGAVPVDAPQHREFLGDILASGRHLLQLINDILDLSKIEAGKLELHAEDVDLRALVAEVVAVLKPGAANKQIEIAVSVDPAIDGVVGDTGRLKQVLYNYASNALKFTAEGGRIAIRAIADGSDTILLEVEDNGIGISEEDLPRLFVEFEQLDAGKAKRHAGTGLGLALTKRLVEAQGGRVGVRSRPGEGSTFYAVLPRRLDAARPAPLARSFLGSSPSAPTVLVIEDNPADRDVLVATLTGAGYAVQTASTGTQALAMCRENAFDAITLDLFLPDIAGLDVLRGIRSEGKNRSAPVVVVTIVAEKSAVAGFTVSDILHKPIDTATLVEALSHAIGSSPRGATVLVVDDDEASRHLMEATLARLGHRSISCASGYDALRTAAESPPDAIVLDLLMPGMDGFEFLSHLRGLPSCRTTPVVVWTVRELSAAERERLLVSAQAIVRKAQGSVELVEQLAAVVPPTSPAGGHATAHAGRGESGNGR